MRAGIPSSHKMILFPGRTSRMRLRARLRPSSRMGSAVESLDIATTDALARNSAQEQSRVAFSTRLEANVRSRSRGKR
jgi:hypothetical protein